MLALTIRPGQEEIRIGSASGPISLCFERVSHNKTRIHITVPDACKVTRHDSTGALIDPHKVPSSSLAVSSNQELETRNLALVPTVDPAAGVRLAP